MKIPLEFRRKKEKRQKKRHFGSKHMNNCITDQGEDVCDQKEISIEAGIFSQNFIEKRKEEKRKEKKRKRKKERKKRDDSEISSLSDVEINNIEGKITLKEVTRALKNMKNNRSPSTDSFTSDFFKVF